MSTTWLTIQILYTLCITTALSLGNIEEKIPQKKPDNRGLSLASGLAEAGETSIAYTTFIIFPNQINLLSGIWIIILTITIISRTTIAYKYNNKH